MRAIPRPIHGVLDYLTGLFLLFSPWLCGFAHVQPVPANLATIFGSAILIYTFLTNFELGVIRLIPFPAHLILDVVTGAALAGAPIIFFTRGTAGLVFVIVGVFRLVTTMMTRIPGRSSGRPGFPSWT
ncbi:SPW repeat domain-containing protein [Verrucomicrobiota bacterium sgz303538]